MTSHVVRIQISHAVQELSLLLQHLFLMKQHQPLYINAMTDFMRLKSNAAFFL